MNPILKIRQEREMSRASMCRETGIGYSTLFVIERGDPGTIRKQTLTALSELTQKPQEQIQADYVNWRLGQKRA